MTKEKTVHLVFILLGKYWIKNNSFAKKQVIIMYYVLLLLCIIMYLQAWA